MKKNETIDVQLDNDLFVQFEQLVTQLNQMKTQITGIQQNIKQLEKSVKKKMKGIKKQVTKNKGNRQPSGFAKPSKVTKELCEFMNKVEGSEIARTEVTRTLVAYIKENKLENLKIFNLWIGYDSEKLCDKYHIMYVNSQRDYTKSKLYAFNRLKRINNGLYYIYENGIIDLYGFYDKVSEIPLLKENISVNTIEFDTYYEEGIMNA
jgi:hypothetical protein